MSCATTSGFDTLSQVSADAPDAPRMDGRQTESEKGQQVTSNHGGGMSENTRWSQPSVSSSQYKKPCSWNTPTPSTTHHGLPLRSGVLGDRVPLYVTYSRINDALNCTQRAQWYHGVTHHDLPPKLK